MTTLTDESQSNPGRKIRSDSLTEGEARGELFPNVKPQVTGLKEKRMPQRRVSRPSVFLWLCCEGWMKFGPFEWLRFDDELQVILGPDGAEVAKKTDGFWRVSNGRGEGMPFSNPMITSSPIHPHRDSGSYPARLR